MRERTHVVGIGGGTGLSVLLSGLGRCAAKAGRGPVDITAIVSVADDGGSTGKLRRNMGLPAVGDLRNCIVALAHGHPLWNELFQHRFEGDKGLDGHSLGNLVMAALVERHGGLGPAIAQLSRPLGIRGRVLPVTEERVTLCAELEGGAVVRGESRIPTCGQPIKRLWLKPDKPEPADGVLEAIASADAVVFGPGSLYTSLVPNLLVDGVADAIRSSGALRIMVSNLMTQPGETDGFDATDHVRVLERYLGRGVLDVCLVSSGKPSGELPNGARPVHWNRRSLASTGVVPIAADLRGRGPLTGSHDPIRLGETVLSLARGLRRDADVSSLPAVHQPANAGPRPGRAALPIAITRLR